MRVIALMNQKGGVGKTTSSVNISAGLARKGKKVLLVDLDPQAHASIHLGVDTSDPAISIYQVFSGFRHISEIRQLVSENLWVAPASLDLAATELELVDAPGREQVLRKALDKLYSTETFDYVIMDCPPSLGVLTINALTASGEVFIPLQPHFFALQGLSKLLETTALIRRRLNQELRVSGIVLCLYETGTRLATDVTDDLMRFLGQSDGETAWSGAAVFSSRIRRNIKLAESPSFAQSIFDYAPQSSGAKDYEGLVAEIIAQEAGKLQVRETLVA
jgi:chromosome partitioning protein